MNQLITKLEPGPRNTFGLTERDMDVFHAAFSAYPEVEKVVIFGSRAKGNFKPGSDVDLVITDGSIDIKTFLALRSSIEESSLPYKVDLFYLPEFVHKELTEPILRAGIIFYQKVLPA